MRTDSSVWNDLGILWENDGDSVGKQNTPCIRVRNYSFWFGELIWLLILSNFGITHFDLVSVVH